MHRSRQDPSCEWSGPRSRPRFLEHDDRNARLQLLLLLKFHHVSPQGSPQVFKDSQHMVRLACPPGTVWNLQFCSQALASEFKLSADLGMPRAPEDVTGTILGQVRLRANRARKLCRRPMAFLRSAKVAADTAFVVFALPRPHLAAFSGRIFRVFWVEGVGLSVLLLQGASLENLTADDPSTQQSAPRFARICNFNNFHTFNALS